MGKLKVFFVNDEKDKELLGLLEYYSLYNLFFACVRLVAFFFLYIKLYHLSLFSYTEILDELRELVTNSGVVTDLE